MDKPGKRIVTRRQKYAQEVGHYCALGMDKLAELAGSFEKAQMEEPWRSLYNIFNEIDSRVSILEEE